VANGTKKYGRNKDKCAAYRAAHGGGTRRKVSHSSTKNTPFLRHKQEVEEKGTFTMPPRLVPATVVEMHKAWPGAALGQFMDWTGVKFQRPAFQPVMVQVGTIKKAQVEAIPKKRVPS